MIRRFPIAAATLALSLTASASMAAEGNQLSQDDEQLKSALAGAPVIVTLQVASVTLTSSADAMFPSGGWQIASDSPLLNKMFRRSPSCGIRGLLSKDTRTTCRLGRSFRWPGFRTTSIYPRNGPLASRTTSPRMA